MKCIPTTIIHLVLLLQRHPQDDSSTLEARKRRIFSHRTASLLYNLSFWTCRLLDLALKMHLEICQSTEESVLEARAIPAIPALLYLQSPISRGIGASTTSDVKRYLVYILHAHTIHVSYV